MLDANMAIFSLLEQYNIPLVDRMALSIIEDTESIFFSSDHLYSSPIKDFCKFQNLIKTKNCLAIQNGEVLISSHLNAKLPIIAYSKRPNLAGEHELFFYQPA